jgi:hypothetical protein
METDLPVRRGDRKDIVYSRKNFKNTTIARLFFKIVCLMFKSSIFCTMETNRQKKIGGLSKRFGGHPAR